MTTFKDRENEFETRFKLDQELQFKTKARRNRLLGLWAAERMGLSGDDAAAYAKELIDAELLGGDRRVVEKVVADLAAKGHGHTPAQVQFELEHFGEEAKRQIMAA